MDEVNKSLVIYIKNILTKDERNLLFNYMDMFHNNNLSDLEFSDMSQTGLGETIKDVDTIMETLLISKKPIIEKALKHELIPTYSFWRLYTKYSSLPVHTDRQSCEVTISINVGTDRKYPINIDGKDILIDEGDGVLYFGAYLPHSRKEFEGDYAYNVFLHYVLAKGDMTEFKYDKRPNLGSRKQ